MLNKTYSQFSYRDFKPELARVRALCQTWIAAALLPGVLLACPAFAAELNSERIERRFGSYDIEVLQESQRLRVSSLNSRESTGPVCRTFAVVRYDERPRPPALQAAHRKILAGGSIGATLTAAGWTVDKTNRHLGEITPAAGDRRVLQMMQLDGASSLALHIYDLNAVRDGLRIRYATIVEIHHPDYLAPDDLTAIYAAMDSRPLDDAELSDLLTLAREQMHEMRREKQAILQNL